MKKFSKNTIYSLMQMLFWMAYCCCYGFISYYLINKGFNTSIVGIVSAIAGLISAVGQPFIHSIRFYLFIKKPSSASMLEYHYILLNSVTPAYFMGDLRQRISLLCERNHPC